MNAQGPDLDKGYEPAQVEPRLAAFWEQRGFFHAEDRSGKPPYCIVLPPPNVTGSLHIGHALTATIEDALIDRKSTRLNSSHPRLSRMPSSA